MLYGTLLLAAISGTGFAFIATGKFFWDKRSSEDRFFGIVLGLTGTMILGMVTYTLFTMDK